MRWKILVSTSVAVAGLALGSGSSLTPSEQVLQTCLERNGMDASDLDAMVDGRGKIIVVSGVPGADPDGVISDCIEEANSGLE